MLLNAHDAILSDLDGVVYAGPFAIDGAPEALNKAQKLGVPVAFVTNNASRSVEQVAEHLVELGVNTDAEHVVSSAQAAAELLAQRLEVGSRVLITGAQALADCVSAAGLTPVRSQSEHPVAVAQGFNPKIVWEDLAEAAYTLADESVLWVASNTDFTIPKERGIAPGNGTLVNAVATATRRTPLVAGKPESPIFYTAAKALNSSAPVVVGDRLDTDILGGNRAQMATALVFTGVETFESVLAAVPEERPTYLIETLNGFFEEYPSVDVSQTADGVRASAGSSFAEVEGNTVRMSGCDIDAQRAACAAWWAAHPATDAPLAPENIDYV
ncbi:HAD-IIA family hydrolase [Rothia sp. ZJ932]|uniref:HAD-IIA family hydrolase n=1 Tax=Rothia sp. ZJ932 TaxID=2810516 RepID=UPI0019673FCB|nr:HAD-IIA family hydrolase [Rothia sp. ZJ932]QRZ61004.1 HAD-IIA family hydrolase [Rothia sp. ZJ932]